VRASPKVALRRLGRVAVRAPFLVEVNPAMSFTVRDGLIGIVNRPSKPPGCGSRRRGFLEALSAAHSSSACAKTSCSRRRDTPRAMSQVPPDIKALVGKGFTCWNGGEIDLMVDDYADDA
jgi:hypothetical protein